MDVDGGSIGIACGDVVAGGVGLGTFACVLAYVSFTDLRRRIVPNRALAAALIVRMACLVCAGAGVGGIASSLAGGLAVSAPVLLVALALHRVRGRAGVGGGDVKPLFVVGCYLGWWRGLVAEALACLLGSAVTLARALVTREQAGAQEGFPLAPYVALACLAVLLVDAAASKW